MRPKKGPIEHEDDSPSPEVVERCRAGDEKAWAELVEATYRDVYTLCLRILRDPDDAAEATQDAYLKAWRGLAGFRGEAKFSTWLYRVATNAALSKHRSRRRKQSHEIEVDEAKLARRAGGSDTARAAGARLDVASLESALDLLPDHYRQAVVMRDVYGLTIEEIAKRSKCSVTAAKVRVHRGRKKLKEIVFPDEGTEQ
jgi:RNA polymerase sigma-70 factor (ECF subfamily)